MLPDILSTQYVVVKVVYHFSRKFLDLFGWPFYTDEKNLGLKLSKLAFDFSSRIAENLKHSVYDLILCGTPPWVEAEWCPRRAKADTLLSCPEGSFHLKSLIRVLSFPSQSTLPVGLGLNHIPSIFGNNWLQTLHESLLYVGRYRYIQVYKYLSSEQECAPKVWKLEKSMDWTRQVRAQNS